MADLVAAIGLALALEGILFAAFPGFVRRRMEETLGMGEGPMRVAGLAGAAIGVAVVGLARLVLG